MSYQSSHSSSFFLAGAAAPGPGGGTAGAFAPRFAPMADVPMELYLGPVPWRWSATDAKSSQNALRLSSICWVWRGRPSGASTNRVKLSCAPLAPACAALPTLPAASRACAAKSDSASCLGRGDA